MRVCYVHMWHMNTGETPQGLPSLQLGQAGRLTWHWLYLLPTPTLLPTLSICGTPVQRPHFQQLSQRTSWYSQAPAVEKRTLGSVSQSFSSQHPFYGSVGAQ